MSLRKNCVNERKSLPFLSKQILRLKDDDISDSCDSVSIIAADEKRRTDFFLVWNCCCMLTVAQCTNAIINCAHVERIILFTKQEKYAEKQKLCKHSRVLRRDTEEERKKVKQKR